MTEPITNPPAITNVDAHPAQPSWIPGVSNTYTVSLGAFVLVALIISLTMGKRLTGFVFRFGKGRSLRAGAQPPGLSLEDVAAGKDVEAIDTTGKGLDAKRIKAKGDASFRSEGGTGSPKY